MDSRARFYSTVRRRLVPLLRAEGFQGSSRRFIRDLGPIVHVIEFQSSKHGGECRVNLGMHPMCVPLDPDYPAGPVDELTEPACAFRTILRATEVGDKWWSYGAVDAETTVIVDELCAMFRSEAPRFFERLRSLPGCLDSVTPSALDGGDLTGYPGGALVVRAAWVLAHVWRHLDVPERSRAFALVGLKHLGQAVALQADLEHLRDGG